MRLEALTAAQVSDFFTSDPKLCYIALPDEVLTQIYCTNTYYPSDNSCYFGVYYKENLVTVVKWELFTPHTINLHYYTASKYHHTKINYKSYTYVIAHLKENTQFTKALIMTPNLCTHVWPMLERLGWKLEGRLTRAITWRNQIDDLLIYGIDL